MRNGGHAGELALSLDRDREARVLIVPALFEEANKTRHLMVEVMRRLDGAGIDSFLPDLPGVNESTQPLDQQSLDDWRAATAHAAGHFRASHAFAVRAGAILSPPGIPCWRYAPISGASALKALLRARQVADREAGREQRIEELLQRGRIQGIDLAGYRLGPAMVRDLETAMLPDNGRVVDIDQDMVGGGALWLRSEPGFLPDQADALAAIIAIGIGQ